MALLGESSVKLPVKTDKTSKICRNIILLNMSNKQNSSENSLYSSENKVLNVASQESSKYDRGRHKNLDIQLLGQNK